MSTKVRLTLKKFIFIEMFNNEAQQKKMKSEKNKFGESNCTSTRSKHY